jgi:hypothetical protein
LLEGRDDRIDYDQVLAAYPWIAESGQDCIVSPDSDGLLCGLLMTNFLKWRVRGFYDGKALVAHRSVLPSQCVFLDMEIFRAGVRSVGHHMLLYNRNRVPHSWQQFSDALSVNNLRWHDGLHEFRLKYPFATIHFLLALVAHVVPIVTDPAAVAPLLFTDGTYKNLFGYTENCLNWLNYLQASEQDSPLHSLFWEDRYTIVSLMQGMNDFWRARDEISVPGQRGDRVAITERGGRGDVINMVPNGKYYDFAEDALSRAEEFLGLLATKTGWSYTRAGWSWEQWWLWRFTKRDFKQDSRRVKGDTFAAMLNERPLSFAMTANDNYEYTLEGPDALE